MRFSAARGTLQVPTFNKTRISAVTVTDKNILKESATQTEEATQVEFDSAPASKQLTLGKYSDELTVSVALAEQQRQLAEIFD